MQQPPPVNRIVSIDILRGLVMIIMALDHTRDFFHITAFTADPLDFQTTTPILYFTRWITHFCAPTFVLLSGLSAYLSAERRSKAAAGNFLFKRGLWLIFIEVTVITLGLTFNPFYNSFILQVIWAIGISMIILSLLSRVSYKLVLVTGLVLTLGHNVFDYIAIPESGWVSVLMKLFFVARGSVVPLGNNHVLFILYAALPWTGIMLLGYCMGYFYRAGYDAGKRRRQLTIIGLSLIALFLVLRFTGIYGDPGVRVPVKGFWPNLFVFGNTSKYPPSLQYVCMTLGPSLIALAGFERLKTRWVGIISVYGNVPFFYYVLHFYLLHALLVVVFFATGHTSAQIADAGSPFLFRPVLFGFGLPVVYLIWLFVVAALYFPCRWFYRFRRSHNYWWLRYL